ncbi:MAG: YiiD C-terminal domain-containing protein [Stenotrophobium sp.]
MSRRNSGAPTANELTAYLHAQIPLARAMALQVRESLQGVTSIAAPLAPNQNPHRTMFGGSLATLGIICGWLSLHRLLQAERLDALLVVQKSECDFLRPADDAVTATTHHDEKTAAQFLTALRRHGRGRMSVATVIHCRDQQVLIHHGSYVAKTKTAPSQGAA